MSASSATCRPDRVRRGWLPLWLILAVLAPLALAGCQGRFPAERIPRSRWLVMPLEQPPEMGSPAREIRGWWFGARTIRQNERAGIMTADIIGDDLAQLGVVNLFSPIELKYYFARKRAQIQEAYPYLKKEEVTRLMTQQPAVDFARDLGADKVLTGRIIRLYQSENRTFHWWWSVGELEVSVIDATTGQVEFQKHYYDRQQLASKNSVVETISRRLMEDLKDSYFWPLARKAGVVDVTPTAATQPASGPPEGGTPQPGNPPTATPAPARQ